MSRNCAFLTLKTVPAFTSTTICCLNRWQNWAGRLWRFDPLALINKWRSLTERIIKLLQTDTCAWVVANPEPLPIEQAFNIADSFDDFEIEVKGFILNKVLPAELCQNHPFWQAKYIAQQKCREKMHHKANIRPLKEIPELIRDMQIDGFLQEVAGLLHKTDNKNDQH